MEELIMRKLGQKAGFSLLEVLVTMAFVGIMTVLVMPGVMYSASNNDALLKTKQMAYQFQGAVLKYGQLNPDTDLQSVHTTSVDNSLGIEITNLTKFTHKVTDGSVLQFTNKTAIAGSGYNPVCTAGYPCYYYPDGGFLRFHGNIQDGAGAPFYSTNFAYDPDGTGAQSMVMLVVDYRTGRVVTQGAFYADASRDPSYVQSWSAGS